MPHRYDHLVFRGDQYAYLQKGGRFPYLEHAAAAGANGVHVWFWGDAFKAVARDYTACCRDLGLKIHLGIGIGAYGVCDGKDPLAPATMGRIRDHLRTALDLVDVAGVEFQTGEYDKLEFKGASVAGKSRAQQVCEHLNPYLDYILELKPSLWVRTELHAGYFPPDQAAHIAGHLDPRCMVEWSHYSGPYRGEDCFERGRQLLSLDPQFTWFLKLHYNRQTHWHEHAKDQSLPELRRWAEHWRGWTRLLVAQRRPTLTICHVCAEAAERPMPVARAAVALAVNPELPIDEFATC